jgi:hypothetical protein
VAHGLLFAVHAPPDQAALTGERAHSLQSIQL